MEAFSSPSLCNLRLFSGRGSGTHQPVQAECASGPTTLGGSIRFKSSNPGYTDQLYVGLISVAALGDEEVYEGWLVAEDGSKLSLGVLPVEIVAETTGQLRSEIDPNFGNIIYTYNHPSSLNLMSQGYNKFMITVESILDNDPEPSAKIAYSDEIPLDGLEHIRSLLYSWEGAPEITSGPHLGISKGIVVGLYEQTDLALAHAALGVNSTSLDAVKLHAQHIVNIVEGAKGDNYDISYQDPGDGFGLLAYARKASEFAKMAVTAHADRHTFAIYEPNVSDPASNVESWASMSRDKALIVLKAPDLSTALAHMGESQTFLTWAVSGHDIDGDDFIRPVIGEGGALHAQIGAQNMAQFFPSALIPQPEDVHDHRDMSLSMGSMGEEDHEEHDPLVASVETVAQPELPAVPVEPAVQPAVSDSDGTSGTTIAIVVIAVAAVILLSGGGLVLVRRHGRS